MLKLDWASYHAAVFACKHWHYSKSVPAGALVKVGVWESEKFVGVVLFGRGANNRMTGAYSLRQDQACELVRVALREHVTPVSRIISIAIKFLRKKSPGLRLIVSYADQEQGHHGGIYQAGNLIYAGKSQAQKELIIDGVFTHKRTAHSKYGTASPDKIAKITGAEVAWSPVMWKHIYLMPLDDEIRSKIVSLSKVYPKRMKDQAPESHSGLGGETPTRALHIGD